MATYAVCQAEILRLRNLKRRLIIRLMKAPIVGNDGSPEPSAGDDYFLAIRDLRRQTTNAAIPTLQKNQLGSAAQSAWITAGRWHNTASTNEHITRYAGQIRGTNPTGITQPYAGGTYRLHNVLATREGGLIGRSDTLFT